MNLRLLICCLGLLLHLSARAGVIYSATSGSIPDGSAVGWSATAAASGYNYSLSSVTVNLNLSGGYNGDLYAYLSYGGVLVPLLNRVGVTGTGSGNAFGYGDTGFNITLSSAAGYNDVHFYGNYSPNFNGSGQLTETWQPDGRNIDPQSSPSTFDTASRVNFGAYNNMNPNGTWTLFIADLSSGASSQVVSWSLDITAVPEPINVALGLFSGVFGMVAFARNQTVRGFLRRTFAR
jgi:hypothetical protein